MKTMVSRVRAYLAHRRALGFRLRSEGYLMLSFGRYADRVKRRRPLTRKLAITWASLPKDAGPSLLGQTVRSREEIGQAPGGG